jgi:hypothetical protein
MFYGEIGRGNFEHNIIFRIDPEASGRLEFLAPPFVSRQKVERKSSIPVGTHRG